MNVKKGRINMKRILILSDSHGNTDRCMQLVERYKGNIDAVIHAGDYARDAEDIESVYDDIPIYYVCGNTDLFSMAASEKLVEIDGLRIFIAHGHEYRVKYESDYRTIAERARQLGASLCVFGHTHKAYNDTDGKLTLVNPGSIQFGGTYAVAEIEDGRVKTAVLEY
jgi:hypothetical protein